MNLKIEKSCDAAGVGLIRSTCVAVRKVYECGLQDDKLFYAQGFLPDRRPGDPEKNPHILAELGDQGIGFGSLVRVMNTFRCPHADRHSKRFFV